MVLQVEPRAEAPHLVYMRLVLLLIVALPLAYGQTPECPPGGQFCAGCFANNAVPCYINDGGTSCGSCALNVCVYNGCCGITDGSYDTTHLPPNICVAPSSGTSPPPPDLAGLCTLICNLNPSQAPSICACVGATSPSPPSPPPPGEAIAIPSIAEAAAEGHYLTLLSGAGSCEVQGANSECFTDGAGAYGHDEKCEARVNLELEVSSVDYNVEYYFDYITLKGVTYRTGVGPEGVLADAGDTIQWSSDASVSYSGFTICADKLAPPPPPMPTCNRRIAMAVVLDRSGSMTPYASPARTFARSLVGQLDMDFDHSRAAVIAFNEAATLASPLSSDRVSLETAISTYGTSTLPTEGLTHISNGLALAKEELLKARADGVGRN